MPRRTRAHDPSKVTRHTPAEVEVRNVAHPRIWSTAIQLAGGEKGRITVESYSRITVEVKEATPQEVSESSEES